MTPLDMLHNIIFQLPGVVTHSTRPHSLPGVIHDRHYFVHEETLNLCVCKENEATQHFLFISFLFLHMHLIYVESNDGLSPREVTQQTLPHPAPPPLLQHAHVLRDKTPHSPAPSIPYNKPHVKAYSQRKRKTRLLVSKIMRLSIIPDRI